MEKICFLQAVNASLQQFGVFAEDLSVDNQMVPYFGSHSCKIFIRSNKNCILASSCGYLLKFAT